MWNTNRAFKSWHALCLFSFTPRLSSQRKARFFPSYPVSVWTFNASAVWITDRVEHRLTNDSCLSHSVWLRVCTRQARLHHFGPSAQGDSELPCLWVEPLCGLYQLQRWTQSELFSSQLQQLTETENVTAAHAERSYYDNPAHHHGWPVCWWAARTCCLWWCAPPHPRYNYCMQIGFVSRMNCCGSGIK